MYKILVKENLTPVIDFMKETNPLGNVLAKIYNYLLRKDLRFASYYMEVAHHFPFDTYFACDFLSILERSGRVFQFLQRLR